MTKGLNALKAVARQFVFESPDQRRNRPAETPTETATNNQEGQAATPNIVTPMSAGFMGFFSEQYSANHQPRSTMQISSVQLNLK